MTLDAASQSPTRAAATRRPTRAPRLRYGLVSVASAAGFILLWEGLAASGIIDPEFFPPPTRVSSEFLKLLADGTLLDYALVSTRRVVVGFALSALLGISLG